MDNCKRKLFVLYDRVVIKPEANAKKHVSIENCFDTIDRNTIHVEFMDSYLSSEKDLAPRVNVTVHQLSLITTLLSHK